MGDTGEIQKKAHLTKLALQVCTYMHMYLMLLVQLTSLVSGMYCYVHSAQQVCRVSFQIYADHVYLVVTNRLMWF